MVQIKFKFELKFKNVLSSVRTLVQLEKVQFSSSSERESSKLRTSDAKYEQYAHDSPEHLAKLGEGPEPGILEKHGHWTPENMGSAKYY